MTQTGLRGAFAVALCALLIAGGCSEGDPITNEVSSIYFQTTEVDPAGAGQFYDMELLIGSTGEADPSTNLMRFELTRGQLPPGVSLVADAIQVDNNGDPVLDADGNTIYDPNGVPTGNARLLGFPRNGGNFDFTVKAIHASGLSQTFSGGNPALSAEEDYMMQVGAGAVNIITPTAAEGTSDPQVPAFPDVIDFVNPANPQAFFSFAFQAAGGSGSNFLSIYMPRELELSVFDTDIIDNGRPQNFDSDESLGSGNKFLAAVADGGLFVTPAGNNKVQVGGYQSPRATGATDGGVVDPSGWVRDDGAGGTTSGMDPDWFQPDPGDGGAERSSRPTKLDPSGQMTEAEWINKWREGYPVGKDDDGNDVLIKFSDYFDSKYIGTQVDASTSNATNTRKYSFVMAEYMTAFALPSTEVTPLRYRIIVEAIDNGGTIGDKQDDYVARKAYNVQVKIPDIVIDTVFLPNGTTGVHYNEFVNASGGVPPLSFELEFVDGNPADECATDGADITQEMGLWIVETTGQFVGVPRGTTQSAPGAPLGLVDLTVRVFASQMSVSQNSDAFTPAPTGNKCAPEGDGTHPVTGKKGAHKTYQVGFAYPSMPALSNASVPPGKDQDEVAGAPDPYSATLQGSGGVPKLFPYPVGWVGVYPADPQENYLWEASYTKDDSYTPPNGYDPPQQGEVTPGFPEKLTLDGAIDSSNNGRITGTATDRGFHTINIRQTDAFVGHVSTASGPAQEVTSSRVLSISPDSAVYLRGSGEASGLIDPAVQTGDNLMVPLFTSTALFTADTGETPVESSVMSDEVDILPVLISHGGGAVHNIRSAPSVGGYDPAEAGHEPHYARRTNGRGAWRHYQQEFTWVQDPSPAGRKVFMYASLDVRKWNDSSSGSGYLSQRYGTYDETGVHGVLIVEPGGYHWNVCEIDNDSADGKQFGASVKVQRPISGSGYAGYSYNGTGYWKWYYYPVHTYTRPDREALNFGAGQYIMSSSTLNTSMQSMQRNATTVAMSADGAWCATAMPGGENDSGALRGKILVWRTTRSDPDGNGVLDIDTVPGGWGALPHVKLLNGKDKDGNTVNNTAAVFTIEADTSNRLLPDSLMFVDGGLIFMLANQMNRIYGIDLVDGSIDFKDVNTRTAPNGRTSLTDVRSNGMNIPDTDTLRAFVVNPNDSAQFLFAGDKPEESTASPDYIGRMGPDTIAFVGGTMRNNQVIPSTSVDTNTESNHGHFGYVAVSNSRYKAMLSLSVARDAAGGINLSGSTVRDLTGNDSRIYGDLLAPGRDGEHLGFLNVSDDGKWVAGARDATGDSGWLSGSFVFVVPTYATYISGSSSFGGEVSHDLIVASTDGTAINNGTSGHDLGFFGTRNWTSAAGGDPSMPGYGFGDNVINGKYRRIKNVRFSRDNASVFFDYAADDRYNVNIYGYVYGWLFDPADYNSSSFNGGAEQVVRIEFGPTVNMGTQAYATNPMAVKEVKDVIGSVGDENPPFTNTGNVSEQWFHTSFVSYSGNFVYYVSDPLNDQNFMIGFNISGGDIISPEGTVHKPFVAFLPHDDTIGFPQFDSVTFQYASRFAAGTDTVTWGGGMTSNVMFVTASAAGSANDSRNCELYAFMADLGGMLYAVSTPVTTGATNNINYLTPSMDGNVIAFHLNTTSGNSSGGRADLTTKSQLCACTNVHAVLISGGTVTPNCVSIISGSIGSSVAFVGEGTEAGPQAVVFSHTGTGGDWDERQLKVAVMAAGATPDVIDSTPSHSHVLAGTRNTADNPTDGS
jgi:hypothetical protein